MGNHIEWDDKYSIGIEQIDKQHMHLVDLLNRMEDACRYTNENTENTFISVMKESAEYVLIHFRDEEQLMRSIKYCNFAEHKALHEQFIKKICETTKNFNNEDKDVYQDYTEFLRNWLFNHIAIHDKLIGIAYLNQK